MFLAASNWAVSEFQVLCAAVNQKAKTIQDKAPI